MSSAVFGEDKLSEEVHELLSNTMGAISSLEKPMSPVLTNNKDSKKLIQGKRIQSRINLATKFNEVPSKQSAVIEKHSKSKELPDEKSKNDDAVDKLNKVRDVEKRRKKCYSVLSTNNIKVIGTPEEKSVDVSEKVTKKTTNSSPKNKVSSHNQIPAGTVCTVKESKSKPLKFIKEPNQDAKSKETIINIHIKGFKTAKGKNIEVSEDALKKGTGVLEDILNPTELLEVKSKLNNNKANINAHKINNPNPSRIKLCKNKVETIPSDKSKKTKSNSQKNVPEMSEIHKKTMLKQSDNAELIHIENQTKYEKPEKLSFTQEELTDTQMNFIVDNIIPEIDNSQINAVDNLSKNYLKKCISITNSNETKSNYLPNEEFQISTQETNMLFSNFTQNIVNNSNTSELKQITENAIDNIYIAEDNFNASSSELLFKGFQNIESNLSAMDANKKNNRKFHGYNTIECLESSNRREVLKNMLTKLELDIKESFHKKLLCKYNRDVKNIRKIQKARRDVAVNTEKNSIEEGIAKSVDKHPEIKVESYTVSSTRIKPRQNVEIEIKNNNQINININSNFNKAEKSETSPKLLEKSNLITTKESSQRKRRFKRKTENVKKADEMTAQTIEPSDNFNCHQLQLGKSVKEAFEYVKFNPMLDSNKEETEQILRTDNKSELTKNSKQEDDFEYSPEKKRVKSESGSCQKKIEKKNLNPGEFKSNIKGNNNQILSGFKSASGNLLLISEKTYKIAQQVYTEEENVSNKKDKENIDLFQSSGFKSAAGKVLPVSSESFSKAKQIFGDVKSDLPLWQNITANNLELVGKSSSDHSANFIKRVKRKRNNLNKSRWENQRSLENIYKTNTASLPSFQHLHEEKKFANPIPTINSITLAVTTTKPENIFLTSTHSTENNCTTQLNNNDKTLSGFQSASGKQLRYSNECFKKANKMYLSTDECDDLNNKTMFQPNNSGFTLASGQAPTVSKDSYRKAKELFADVDNEIQINSLELSPLKETLFTTAPDTINANIKSNERSLINIKSNEILSSQCVSYSSNKSEKKAHEIIEDVVHAVDKVLASIEKKQQSRNTLLEKKSLGMTKFKQIEIPQEKLEKAKALFDDCNLSKSSVKQSFADLTMCISTPTRKSNYKKFPGDHITPIKNIQEEPEALITKSNISLNEPETCNLNDLEIELEKIRQKYLVLKKRKETLQNQINLIEFGDENHRRQRPGYLYTNKANRIEKINLKDVNNLYEHSYANGNNKLLNSIIPKSAYLLHFDADGEEVGNVVETIDGAILIPNNKNKIGIKEFEMAFKAMPGVDPLLIPKAWISNHYKWIVWKLVSYERRFPNISCVTIENVVQQLKYRYDREIDKAERSALRKILEKDDVPEKRMVLCVSDIFQISEKQFELELTDGWYALRTIIDIPLCSQLIRKNIVIGTKLLIQGATILNSEGCAPLEVPDFVRLKIGYNNSRKATWDSKLGYQKVPFPYPIPIKSIHPYGGLICCLKLYIARVYPLKYLEEQDGKKVWRNDKAENTRRKKIEREQETEIDRIVFNLQQEYKGYFNKPQQKHSRNITKQELDNINCPKTLCEILESSLDPDNIMDMLSQSQRSIVLDYNQRIISEKQLELNEKINKKVNEFKGKKKRNVSALLKLLVYDLENNPQQGMSFYIWRPTEVHLQILKEESSFLVYNVMPRKCNEIVSTTRTSFKSIPCLPIKDLRRTLLPIATLMDEHYTPLNNEFDTAAIVIDSHRQQRYQDIWLADFVGRLLHVKIWYDASECILIDNYEKGGIYSLSNLIYCKPQLSYASALGNHLTVISSYPEQKYLHEAFEQFKSQLPQDLTILIDNAAAKIDMCIIQDDIRRCTKGDVELPSRTSNSETRDSWDEYEEDSTIIPSRLTSTDIAMSLINTEEYN